MDNTTEDESKVIIVYRTYTPGMKQSQQKYYEKNKENIIQRNVNYYYQKKDTVEYKRNKAIYNKSYNERKKLKQQQQEQGEKQQQEPDPNSQEQ